MSVTLNAKILVKTGLGTPGTTLELGEIGFDASNLALYIGNGVGSAPTSIVALTLNKVNLIDASLGRAYLEIDNVSTRLSLISASGVGEVSTRLYSTDNNLSDVSVRLSNQYSNVYLDASFLQVYIPVGEVSTRLSNYVKSVSSNHTPSYSLDLIDSSTTTTDIKLKGLGTNGGLTIQDYGHYLTYELDITNVNKIAEIDQKVPYTGATQDVSLGVNSLSGNSIVFDQNPTIVRKEGQLFYDVTNKTLSLHTANDVTLQIGQENHILVKNNTGTPIPNGSLVYQAGVDGNIPTIDLAIANDITKSFVIGMATQEIGDASTGLITAFGLVNDLDTQTFTAGQKVYLSESVLGGFTANAPAAPNKIIRCGTVVNNVSGTGSVLITIHNPRTITSLTDVQITAPSNDQILVYNTDHWENINDPALTGLGSGDTNQIAIWDTSSALRGSANFLIDASGNHLVIGQTTIDASATLVVNSGTELHNTIGRFKGFNDDFAQIEIKNDSSISSADIVASADNANDIVNYIDVGINNTYYAGAYGNSNPLDGYLILVTDPSVIGGNLLIGNQTFGKDVLFYTGENGDAYVNEKLRITYDGSILIGKPDSKQYKVEVLGDINASGNFRINGVVQYDNNYIDASLILRLKEASLGYGFNWNNGLLDVSVVGGSGVSVQYVDGSLAERDASINYLYGQIGGGGATIAYVDGSLATRDSEINDVSLRTDAARVLVDDVSNRIWGPSTTGQSYSVPVMAYAGYNTLAAAGYLADTAENVGGFVWLDRDVGTDKYILKSFDLTTYIDGSFGSRDITIGEVSTRLSESGPGVSQTYVDGSLGQRDISINYMFTGLTKITVSASEPGTPNTGDLWIDISL